MAAPIGHTCPDIDKVIKSIRSAIKTAVLAQKHTEDEDAKDALHDIEWELDGLEDKLEELRAANSSLREWGEGLEEELDETKSELETLKEVQP